MNKIDTPRLPHDYAVCIVDSCPLKDTCIRGIARTLVPADTAQFVILNPSFCTGNQDCPNYKEKTEILYAKGFEKLINNMTLSQHEMFKSLMMEQYTRSPYYARRNGSHLLSPEEQEFVAECAKKAGYDKEVVFDGYQEKFCP